MGTESLQTGKEILKSISNLMRTFTVSTHVLRCSTINPITDDPLSVLGRCHLIVTTSGSSVGRPGKRKGLPGAEGGSEKKKKKQSRECQTKKKINFIHV